MSMDRQYGVHEIPGAEEPAPTRRPETVSAGFESQMRGYVNQIWSKLAELEGKIDDFAGWRADIAEALKASTGFDPRELSSPDRPVFVPDVSGARGERAAPPSSSPKPPHEKPWEAAGVSRRTWYRRHKSDAA